MKKRNELGCVLMKWAGTMAASLVVTMVPCSAAVLQVDLVGGEGVFTNIQEAITAASAGDTIQIAAGDYTEVGQLVISSDLSIVGAGQALTTIRPSQDTGGPDDGGDTRGWFLVEAGVAFNLSGVTLDGDGRKINQGVRSRGTGTIADCTIRNIVWDERSGLGIVLFNNMTVTGCTFENMGRVGVIAHGTDVTDARIVGNRYTGKGAVVGLEYALQVGAGASAIIRNNIITDCLSERQGFASVAIFVEGGSTATIENNTITNNTIGIRVGYDETDPCYVEARWNDLSGNVWGINSTLEPTQSEENWFGSAAGPTSDTNPGGDGSIVTGPVSISPWLGDGVDMEPDAVGFQPNLTTVYYLPSGLWFSTQPVGGMVGVELATQPVLTVTNEVGETATQYNGSVTLAIALPNPGTPVPGVLDGTLEVPVVNGVATFTGLRILDGSGEGYTLVATTLTLPEATSAAFDISNYNVAPVLEPIGNQFFNGQETLTFTVVATDQDDPPQTLTFSLVGDVPDGAVIDPETGVFSWTPTETQSQGRWVVRIRVTDNGEPPLSDEQSVSISVRFLSPISISVIEGGARVLVLGLYTPTLPVLQSSPDLLTPDWQEVPEQGDILPRVVATEGEPGYYMFTLEVDALPVRFFRFSSP